MLEENGETGPSVLGVADVDLVRAVMLPCVANVETIAVCGAHVSRVLGVTSVSTLHPSGANGFAL